MKKTYFVPILLMSLALALTGCGGGSASYSQAAPTSAGGSHSGSAVSNDMVVAQAEVYEYYNEEKAAADSAGGFASIGQMPPTAEARKVVSRAEFYLSTDDFDGTISRLDHKIAVSGSYLQQTEVYAATEYSGAYASLTIRVPIIAYGDFKAFLTDLAELKSSRESGEDVTVQYYDTESRLKVLRAQEERINSFIAKATDIDEIFKIERELIRISTEIEQLTTVKNRLDNLTSYATVYVQISDGKFEYKPVRATFGERINNALDGSVKAMIAAGQAAVLIVIWCWPLFVVAGVVFLVVRKVKNKRKADKEGKKES